MTKNEENKCDLKNNKVEHVLLYHFLNDENHTQTVSPGKKNLYDHMVRTEAAFALLYICVYLKEKNLN